MKARFIVEAKSWSWRALTGNAFRLEHRGLSLFRNITHRGPGAPAGGEEDSHGRNGLGSHISEGRWANIPQGPTHQGRRRRGALPAEVSLDSSRQLSSLWASHGCWRAPPWGGWKLGRMSQPLSSESLTPPVDPLWPPLPRANRPRAEWSALLLQPTALLHLSILCFGAIRCRSLTCAADLGSSQKASCWPPCQFGSDV